MWFKVSLLCTGVCGVSVCVSDFFLMSPDGAAPGIASTPSPPALSVTVPDQLLHTCRLRPVIFTGQAAPHFVDVAFDNGMCALTDVINHRLDYFGLQHSRLTSPSHQLLTGWCHL